MKKPKLCITLLVIKHSGHLRTLEICRKTRLRLVYSTFPSCSQTLVMFYHSVIHGLGYFTDLLNIVAAVYYYYKFIFYKV